MTPVTTESIISTSPISDVLDEYRPRTVVFDFGPKVKPIAVQLDYLYLESDKRVVYPIQNYETGVDKTGATNLAHVFPSYDGSITPKNITSGKYKFLNTIRELAFRYGIQHEYYKNKYGKWIDMGTIRPHFAVKKYEDNIFSQLFTGTINDDIMESSIYTKVCDNRIFDCTNTENQFVQLCQLKDVNDVPASIYFVKDPYDHGAYMYKIGRGDNTYKYEKCKVTLFTDTETDAQDTVHDTTSPRFYHQLADADSRTIATGNMDENNAHMFNDLVLTFIDRDGAPYTDLNNLFIMLNGMVVGYTLSHNDNQIYLKDVVKYAERQAKSIAPINVDNYKVTRDCPNGGKIVDYEIPREYIGYVYSFDIKIYRWENVTVSDIIQPISTGKVLKTVSTESNKSFWLVNALKFAQKIDKDKCILLSGNQIVDKNSWEVDSEGVIKLTTVEAEFDFIYSEIYPKLKEYLASTVSHEIITAPDIEDFLRDNNDSEEAIDKAYELYKYAYDQWKQDTGSDEHHFTKSAFDVTVEQFNNRQYGLIMFGNESERDYEVNIIENVEEIKLNHPGRDMFTNVNWTLDDIVIVNGQSHQFVNIHENVFIAPDKWYRHGTQGVFDDAYAYKLEPIKHDVRHDAYYRLNFTELVAGPQPDRTYYIYDEEHDAYLGNSQLPEFEHVFEAVPEYVRTQGYNTNQTYFTKVGNDYEVVPQTNKTFLEGTEYYTCKFLKHYYMRKGDY